MIKINLLPKSINEKKIVRNIALLFAVLLVLIVAGGIGYTQMVLVPQVQDMRAQATAAEQLETEVKGIEDATNGIKQQTAPIESKLTFVSSVLDYNKKYPALYEEIAKWTYEKISYTGLSCDGTEVALSARARNLEDLGRYLLNMYRATDLFTEVSISGVPGYPAGANSFGGGGISMPQGPTGTGPQANLAGMPAIQDSISTGRMAGYIGFTVNCKLKTPIVAPTFTGGTTAGAAGDAGAAGAAPASPGMAPPPQAPAGPGTAAGPPP